MPNGRNGDELDPLLAEVLATPAVEPELLARYADSPEALPPEVRRRVADEIARSPELADQLRVLQSFDPTRVDAAPARATSSAVSRVDSGLAAIRRWLWSPAFAYATAALLLLAFGAQYLIGPVASPEPGPDVARIQSPEARDSVLRDSERQAELLARAEIRADAAERQQLVLAQETEALRLELADARSRAEAAGSARARLDAIEAERDERVAGLDAQIAGLRAELAETKAAAENSPGALPQGSIVLAWAGPLYRAPAGSASRPRATGALRGAGSGPLLIALAPEHVARTRARAPTLYWRLAELPSGGGGFRFTLSAAGLSAPIVDTALPVPPHPGLQRIPLADHGVALEPGVEYRWTVSYRVDRQRPARDVLAQAWLLRVVDAASPFRPGDSLAQRALTSAQGGYWYDALHAIEMLLEADPDAADLLRARSALLEEAGLATP